VTISGLTISDGVADGDAPIFPSTGSTFSHNQVIGGNNNSGLLSGNVNGGSIYNYEGTSTPDPTTVITKNHASTSGDNVWP
jgi:hypothetical protein